VGLRPSACWDCEFESFRGHRYLFLVCCQVEVSAAGRSLVQRSPTECGVSECDTEASIARSPWPSRGCGANEKTILILLLYRFINHQLLHKERESEK
jgi:hypothetical protein